MKMFWVYIKTSTTQHDRRMLVADEKLATSENYFYWVNKVITEIGNNAVMVNGGII